MGAIFQDGDPEFSGRWLLRKLARHRTVRVLLVRGLGMVALFGFEVTLARWLGAGGYGAFSFALAVAMVVSRLAPLGWLNASTRYVSAFVSSHQLGLLRGTLIMAHAVTGFGLAISALLLMLLGLTWQSATLALYIPHILPLMFALTVVELHRYVLRGLHSGDLGEALSVLFLPVLAAASVWIFGIRDPATATYAYSLACLPLILLSTIAIAYRIPAGVWRVPARYQMRDWSAAGLAMLVGSLSDELTTRMAVIILGTLGNEHEAGLYQAAARLALLNVFVLRVVTPVAAPTISALHQEGKFTELRSMFGRLCLMSLIGTLPIFVLFQLAAEPVLGWFGPEFTEAGGVLRLLSVGYLVSAATGPCATALMMIGRERIYGKLALANLLLNAVGSYVLVQYFGGFGAAIAMTCGIVVTNLVYVAIFLRATAPSHP